ncbi:hypothetical protein K458DRAFT_383018 [Lentithecium fluviatile CBS 122367]|uniref:Uncharacterized protein n=1 Tax=Lentithecium fluviatile CBS 122367 TaxID=1168545 RepID=A0A6G1JHF3_9PLEO|nr:hypothetical protein K458DRAFT_383018 [Lentithecium fluviatile CBS 122367]
MINRLSTPSASPLFQLQLSTQLTTVRTIPDNERSPLQNLGPGGPHGWIEITGKRWMPNCNPGDEGEKEKGESKDDEEKKDEGDDDEENNRKEKKDNEDSGDNDYDDENKENIIPVTGKVGG